MNQATRLKVVIVSAIIVCTLIVGILTGSNSPLGIVFGAFIVIGIPILILFVKYPFFGMIATFVFSFFILGMLRFIDVPLGIGMDAIILYQFILMLVGLYTQKEKLHIRNPMSILLIVWICYNILQIANPAAESTTSWIYAVRPIAFTMLIYFVAYRNIKTYYQIRFYMYTVLALSLLLALYGLYQEFNGLSAWEEAWVRADKERLGLFFNWWRFRKFSFFADPMTFGVTCAYSGTFAMILAFGNAITWWKRVVLLIAAGLMFFSMVFSGTRTAYVMPVAGLAFFVLLNFNTRIIILTSILFAGLAGVIFSPIKSLGPLDANNLERIRSAFMPTEDASFNVRLKNQAMIQPYIQTHPIGGGIGSTGQISLKFTPYTMLSQFQVDSGFVKIGVEQGMLGLTIYCLLLFFTFKTGIEAYFLTNNHKIRTIISALLCMLFSIVVANYAQEVITMYPTSILVYCTMGAISSFHWQLKNQILL